MLRSLFLGRYWLGRPVTELPVTFDLNATIFEYSQGRRKFVDAFVDRKRRGT